MNQSIRVLLSASLLINILLGGMFLGHFYKKHFQNHFNEQILSTLPFSKKVEFEAAMEKVRAEEKPLDDQIKVNRDTAINMIGADKFDNKSYMDLVEKNLSIKISRSHHMSEAISKLAQNWSLEDRKTLAQMLRQIPFDLCLREKTQKNKSQCYNLFKY